MFPLLALVKHFRLNDRVSTVCNRAIRMGLPLLLLRTDSCYFYIFSRLKGLRRVILLNFLRGTFRFFAKELHDVVGDAGEAERRLL